MANLQKVIKVTQAQYDILAAGGTVGSYTGLNDNYVYLVVDENEYITSNGGILNGSLDVATYNGGSIRQITQNNHITSAIYGDYYSGEIIYNSSSNDYMPLFADDNGFIIYSDDSNYHENIYFNTGYIRIVDYTDSSNSIDIDARSGQMVYYNDTAGVDYFYDLPTASGTLALTSDLNNYHAKDASVIPTANGSLDIGSSSYKFKDIYLGGNMFVGGYIDGPTTLTLKLNGSNKYYFNPTSFIPDATNTADLGSSSKYWKDIYLAGELKLYNGGNSTPHYWSILDDYNYSELRFHYDGVRQFTVNTYGWYPTGSKTLGGKAYPWTNVFFNGYLGDGNNSNYGLVLPDTTSFTANKTIATTDQLPQIQRFI